MADGGEGTVDAQTIFGKTSMGVASLAKRNGVKTIAFAGKVDEGCENLYGIGISSIFSIMRGAVDIDTALKEGAYNLEKTVENVVRTIII